jgi:hypothetical protein
MLEGMSDAPPVNALVERAISRARLSSDDIAAAARRRNLAVSGDSAVVAVTSLRRLPPDDLDPLAAALARPPTMAAAAQGFATGFGGVLTLPLRLSTDAAFALWFAVRATSGAMGAYGFPPDMPEGEALLRTGLLSITGGLSPRADPWGAAARHVVVDPSGARLLASSARLLLRRVASMSGRSVLCRTAPVVGGAVAATANASAVGVLARRARAHYREVRQQWQAAVDAGDLDAGEPWPRVSAPPSLPRG